MPEMLTPGKYNGHLNYPTWSALTWLSDETAYPRAQRCDPSQLRNIAFITEAGNHRLVGHMINIHHVNPNTVESVDVGKQLVRSVCNLVDWRAVWAFVQGAEEGDDIPLADFPSGEDAIPHPTHTLTYYFNMGASVKYDPDTGEVLEYRSSARSRAWAFITGQLFTGQQVSAGSALREYVEMTLWGEHTSACLATDLLGWALNQINWDAYCAELFQLDDDTWATLHKLGHIED